MMYLMLILFFAYKAIGGELGIADNFGPYELIIKKYEICKGPKKNDVANFSLSITGKDSVADFGFQYKEQTVVSEVKIFMYTLKDGKKSLLFNYKIQKPCTHPMIKVFMEQVVHVKNCVMKKANYNFKINFTEYMTQFYGESFFYGEYLIKVVSYSVKGNLCCYTVLSEFKRK